MAASPRYKIFRPDGEYVAACKYVEDAAVLLAVLGAGATIRNGHRKRDIVWIEGETGNALESYDAVATHVYNVEEDRRGCMRQ